MRYGINDCLIKIQPLAAAKNRIFIYVYLFRGLNSIPNGVTYENFARKSMIINGVATTINRKGTGEIWKQLDDCAGVWGSKIENE